MRRAWILAALLGQAALAGAGIYPMEGGTLRRENHALSLSSAAAPLSLAWASPACYGDPAGNPVILTDRVLQAMRGGLICRSRCGGDVIWSKSFNGVGGLWNPPAYDATRDLLYQICDNGALVAVRPSDGSTAWSLYEGNHPKIRTLGAATYAANRIYYANANKSFVCVDADTRAQIWRHDFNVEQGATTPAVDGGFIYVAGTKGEIICLDAATGAVSWDILTSCMRSYASSVLLTDTRLYVQTWSGLVECRLRSDGSLQWSYQTDSYGLGNMGLGDQLYCTSDDRYVHKLDLVSGALLWKHHFTGNFARSGAFYCGGIILASGCTGDYYGLDASGNTVFSYSHGADNSFTDWAEADGLLYVTNRVGIMHCFAPSGIAAPAACTPSLTASPSGTPTPSPSASYSPSLTMSPTPTQSPTPSATPTPTPSASPTPSVTLTPTISATLTITTTPRYDDVPSGHDPSDLDDGHGGVYPNPVRGGHCRVAFRMREGGSSRIRVYAADGSEVGSYSHEHAEGGLKSVECDFSAYAPGVYFFIVDRKGQSGRRDKTKLEKFIIIK